jgi:deoxyribodipyrimidine photo-lyase
MEDAAEAFAVPATPWDTDVSLADILAEAGIERVVCRYLPTGWTRDALMLELAPLIVEERARIVLGELDRATWPHAKAGFFGVKKQIEPILRELGITGSVPAAGAG